MLLCSCKMTDPFSPDSAPRWRCRSKLSAVGRTAALNYYSSPDWWRLRAAIMKALQDFPEARENVVNALRSLNALKDPKGPPS
jgi:hypothetical protein